MVIKICLSWPKTINLKKNIYIYIYIYIQYGAKLVIKWKKEFHSEPVRWYIYLLKINIYDEIITNFDGHGIPKEDVCCVYLSMISLEFVVKVGKKYPQVFFDECKYAVKENKTKKCY